VHDRRGAVRESDGILRTLFPGFGVLRIGVQSSPEVAFSPVGFPNKSVACLLRITLPRVVEGKILAESAVVAFSPLAIHLTPHASVHACGVSFSTVKVRGGRRLGIQDTAL